MTNQDNSSNKESEMKNVNDKPNGPSGDNLKNRFKEGSIPLQTDFADLIDIADIGRRAVGQAPDQTNGLNSTLELNDRDGLAVKINANGGLQANKNGISVNIKDKSLLADSDGLSVNKGKGLWINEGKLEVGNHYGIEIVPQGVKVKSGDGINVDSNGVSVKAKKEHGGIAVNEDGVSIIPDTTTGIIITERGLGIDLGDGLKYSNAGEKLHVDIEAIASKLADLIIPPGTIIPFYSNKSVPHGWVLCDGKNNTPNLNSLGDHCNINMISGSTYITYSEYELDERTVGTGIKTSVHYIRYIMKKIN
ncbi:hypothetical protein QPK13_09155 [Photorhabdus tasmaniensis]